MTARTPRPFLPALGYSWLARAYDPLVRWALREQLWRRRLVNEARLEPGLRVLDIGCGTGSLAILIRRAHPEVEVVGLDADERVLSIARQKVASEPRRLYFQRGLSTALPYPGQSFDRVFSSLMLHHLSRDDKVRTLQEAFRVLRPGGSIHVADWGVAANHTQRGLFYLVQLVDGVETTSDNVNGRLVQLIRAGGFTHVSETAHFSTVFGTLRLYLGRTPIRTGPAAALPPMVTEEI